MYYFIYGLFYLISLLPFFVIYAISDLLSFLMCYVLRYRRKVVLDNLAIAFPEKTLIERKAIARKFYANFIDTLLETIKMISLSDGDFAKRCTVDIEKVNALAAMGKNIQLHGSHQMNWEYANWVFAKYLNIPLVGIYMPIRNKGINKVFYDLRHRYKTVLVASNAFSSSMHQVFKNQYALALAGDQNPGKIHQAYWLNFFNRAVPYVKAPDRGAVRNKAAIVFVRIVILKRGHYHFETEVFTENAGALEPGEITRRYRDFLEASIRRQPGNYLWSHRRWKHRYEERFSNNWIDTTAPRQARL